MKTLAIALTLTFFGITGAQAAGCGSLSTQAEMNKCAERAYKATDRRMNRVYHRAMAAQSLEHKKELRKAQRSWLVYRNRACKSYSNLGEGGSIQPLLYSTCLADLTAQRTKMLQVQTIAFGG